MTSIRPGTSGTGAPTSSSRSRTRRSRSTPHSARTRPPGSARCTSIPSTVPRTESARPRRPGATGTPTGARFSPASTPTRTTCSTSTRTSSQQAEERGSVPRYMVVRKFDVAEDEMPEVGRRSNKVIDEGYPQIVWEHSHVVVDEDGTVWTYCVYEAPTEEMVRDHSNDLGRHTLEAVREIAGDVTPADFPPVPA